MKKIYREMKEIPLEQLNKSKIILFGAGSGPDIFLKRHENLTVEYIVDNDPEKWGQKIEGIEIKSPKILENEEKESIYILITSMYYDAIGEQLREKGYRENIDYFNGLSGALPKVTCTLDKKRIINIFKEFQDKEIKYVILRAFEQLPLWESHDIDILIVEEDIEKVLSISGVSFSVEGIVCELYTYGGQNEYLPYFPEKLSKKLLEESIVYKEFFKIPSKENYLYSYLYHILYRKANQSLEYNNDVWVLRKESKYAIELKKKFQELGLPIIDNAIELHQILREKEYSPSLDLLRKVNLSESIPFLNYLINRYENEIKMRYGEIVNLEIMTFIVRGEVFDANKVKEIESILDKKLKVIETFELDDKEKEKVKSNVRGGNWSDDALYKTGGAPIGYIICIDESPVTPTLEEHKKNVYLSNRNYFIKHTVREELGNSQLNLLHSSDDSFEALEYISHLNKENKSTIFHYLNLFMSGEL